MLFTHIFCQYFCVSVSCVFVLTELKKGLGIHPLAACSDPRSHKAQDFIERKSFIGEDIDLIDTDLVYIEEAEKCLQNLSSREGGKVNEEELFEYADIDVNPSDFDCNDDSECKPNFAGYDSSSSSDYGGDVDCNNNMLFYEGGVGFTDVKEIGNKSDGVDQNIVGTDDALNDSPLDNWKAVLNDLDKCLDITPDDKENGDKNLHVEEPYLKEYNALKDSEACSNNQSMDFSQKPIGDTYERMQSLNCWKHTMLTPPEKLNFCKAIDSVYVTKHRLIESADRCKIEETPVHGSCKSDHDQKEHAARSLNYATGDLGSTGFVKFAQDIDENGCKILIPQPLDYHKPGVALGHRISTSGTKTDDTYFNSQNRSGHLSPFIRSIANRYHLFESSKPHFKQLNIGELRSLTDEESYAMKMLRHQADCIADTKVDQHETSMDENSDLANPMVNQMVNNYVYDIITSEHSKPVSDIDQKSNDIVKQEDDVSMAVCVDDNSLRGVNSKEDLEDSSQEFDETSTLLNMTGSTEPSPTIVSNKMPSGNQQWQSTPNKHTDDVSPSVVTKTILHMNKGLSSTPQRHLVKKLPVSGIIRQRSAFCRIPFSNDAPSFWFSKDFSESPTCKQEVLKKVRSPKRSSSEISQEVPLLVDMAEQTCLSDFKAKIEAFKKDHSEFSSIYSSCSSDHRSPAKKKRKKITCNAITDTATADELLELNTNSNALNELDQSNVRAFFPPKLHDNPTFNFVGSTMMENQPSEGRSQKVREIYCKSSSSISPRKLTGKKFSVSFASSFPDLQDRHSMKKRSIFGKKSKTLAKSPVKLLSFKQWDAVGSQIGCKAKNYQHKATSMGDIFQNFEAYTHNTLKFPKYQGTDGVLGTKDASADNDVTPRNEEDTDVCGVKTYFKFDNEVDDDYVFEVPTKMEVPANVKVVLYDSDVEDVDNDEDNSVSAYFHNFDSPDNWEETAEVSPIKIDQQFLNTSSLGIQPEHHDIVRNHVEQAVKEHLEVTNSVTQGSTEFASMTRTRMNLYNAISAAIESYAPNYMEADVEMCSRQTEDGKKQADLTDQEKSIDNGDVTPDANELVCDLDGLNLSDTPLYANHEADDDDMKVFLNEAVQSLDNILVDSFNSFSESPIKEQTMNKDGNELNESGSSDGEELQDDSILKVVGKKCVLHKMEEKENIACGEPQDSFEILDPDFVVIGKKCVLHEAHPAFKTMPKGTDNLEEDSLNEAVQKLVNYVMEDIGKNPGTLDDLETKNDKAAKSDVDKKMDVNVRDCCSASVDYDEAYDCDGNVTEDRHPACMCSSPLIPFYCTADTLNTDEVEKSFATNNSPILYAATESLGVLNQTEDDLDRTRGSSLNEDLEDTGEDSVFVEESEFVNDDSGCNYVGLEDIQNRMQDSGKWFEKMEDVHSGLNDLEDASEHLSCSTMSSNAPPVFEEKVSTFPSPEFHGNKS